MSEPTTTIHPGKIASYCAIFLFVAAAFTAYFTVKHDASLAKTVADSSTIRITALEARFASEGKAQSDALSVMNIRLERIQTILERFEKDFPIRIKAEVREILRDSTPR